ncbi:isoaspartyl peptidase/L-asparaginase family protein [Nitratidesulfovibrio sp. SRB-5]|uniref:isoaspartyl peptidase/L-asparaginase family protein n=1 Tax=Nitratidesulfovibrio sp. SRB-5 TaxID=2872636 RepID=UPI001027B672|nr:isoaspartyl peptidase/L-asparaginase family protein [Nitratidesulfovibrio sp. SRB-5]MBZ2172845.1 isoaspartyl peptidase/L-asparaginase [Nitratidesulfovibrio sp. SRB-5]RXF76910.1 asparaginase [Desulfovibrio sp. DS-1]
MTEPRIIVHGGAWTIPADRRKAHVDGCRAAVDAVWGELRRGMPALEAVRLAVNVLEADPTYDAGRGAVLNADGRIELDAAIMDGATLNFGAVAAVRNFLHPVDIARKVMDTEFCFLVGEGAERFAREAGIGAIDPAELVVEREVRLYNELRARAGFSTHDAFRPQAGANGAATEAPAANGAACRCPEPDMPRGTVGAVALDAAGNIAAATSTGGTPMKRPGRVGDSPLCGAGTYADNETGGASATGFGEGIIRVLMTRSACDFLRDGGASPADAARRAIELLHRRVAGHAGLIMLDRQGRYGVHCNTEHIAHAYALPGGGIHADVELRR